MKLIAVPTVDVKPFFKASNIPIPIVTENAFLNIEPIFKPDLSACASARFSPFSYSFGSTPNFAITCPTVMLSHLPLHHGPCSPFCFASCMFFSKSVFFSDMPDSMILLNSLLMKSSGVIVFCSPLRLLNIRAIPEKPLLITAARNAQWLRCSLYCSKATCLCSSFSNDVSSLGRSCRISSSVQPNSLPSSTITSAVSQSEPKASASGSSASARKNLHQQMLRSAFPSRSCKRF